MVMGEKSPPRKTFVLNRGQYDQPGDVEIGVGLPVALGQWPTDLPRNRFGFAKWLVLTLLGMLAIVAWSFTS